jgi:raffinose/stachyose/melibiose transport system substrate-binding protein
MMKYTRVAAALASSAVALTVISGCSSAPGSDDGVVTLSFMHRWPDPGRVEYFEGLVESFNESQDRIRVVSSSAASEPYKKQIQVLASQGELPDIYYSLPGDFSQRFIRGGMAADLSDYLDGTEWGESFTAAALEGYKSEDAYFGVPMTMNLAGIGYNTQMFADLGVEQPSTLEDLIDVCDVFRADGVLPVAFGNKEGWPAAHIPTHLNAAYVDPETRSKDYADPQKGSFTDEGYLTALEMSLEVKEHCMADNVNGQTLDPAWAEWGAGEAAMIFMTMGNFASIKSAAETGTVGDEWATMAWPHAAGGIAEQNTMTGAPDGFLVNAKSQHKDAAIEFLQYITSMENAERMAQESGLISAVAGANKTLAPQQQALLDAAGEAESLNIWLDTLLPADIGSVYTTGMQALLGGDATPEEIAAKVQEAAATWQ